MTSPAKWHGISLHNLVSLAMARALTMFYL